MITSLPSPDQSQIAMYDSVSHTLEIAHTIHARRSLVYRPCPPPGLCWAPDSQMLAVALRGVPRLLLTDENALFTCPDPGASPVLALAFSPDGASLVIGKADGEIRLLSLKENRWSWISGMHPSAVTILSFSPDGRTLVSVSLSGLVLIHDEGGHATPIGHCPLLITGLDWERDRQLNLIHLGSVVQAISFPL